MVDLDNIKSFTVNRPESSTLFGTAKEFDDLPASHQAQILFLNKEASEYIWNFSSAAHLITGGHWAPFEKGNFKEVDEFSDFSYKRDNNQALKKWLYKRGIPFSTWVFVLENSNDQAVLTTWKMIVKYSSELFIMPDMMVFDRTLNWCLFYFHEDKLFFGRDNIYDATDDHKTMEELNERKKNFPRFKHPYL